jgi:hypothetical protein
LAKPLTVLFYAVGSIILVLAAVFIILHLLTTEFPTHSDVFWTGVQVGALAALTLILLAFGLFSIHRVAAGLHKHKFYTLSSIILFEWAWLALL